MITSTHSMYQPSLIPSLIFYEKEKCEEFEQALNKLLETKDWKSEWRKVTKFQYTEPGYFDTEINLFDNPMYASKFREDNAPLINNLLSLSKNASDVNTGNKFIDFGNTYYPVLCFLASNYFEKK